MSATLTFPQSPCELILQRRTLRWLERFGLDWLCRKTLPSQVAERASAWAERAHSRATQEEMAMLSELMAWMLVFEEVTEPTPFGQATDVGGVIAEVDQHLAHVSQDELGLGAALHDTIGRMRATLRADECAEVVSSMRELMFARDCELTYGQCGIWPSVGSFLEYRMARYVPLLCFEELRIANLYGFRVARSPAWRPLHMAMARLLVVEQQLAATRAQGSPALIRLIGIERGCSQTAATEHALALLDKLEKQARMLARAEQWPAHLSNAIRSYRQSVRSIVQASRMQLWAGESAAD